MKSIKLAVFSSLALLAFAGGRAFATSAAQFLEVPGRASFRLPRDFKAEIQSCNFAPRKNPNFGFTDKTVWARYELANPTDSTVKKVIWIQHIYLSQAYLFVGSHNCSGLKLLASFGLDVPLSGEVLSKVGGYAIAVSVPPHQVASYYLRVRSKFPLNMPIEAMSTPQYVQSSQKLSLALAFYSAFVLALLLYNLSLFYVTREKTFLYYVLTLLALHLFTNLAQYGVTEEFFFPHWHFLQKNLFHLAHLALIPLTLFITAFFGGTLGKTQTRILWFCAALTVPLALIGIFTDASIVDLLMQSNTTVFCLFLLGCAGYLTFFKRTRPAVYFFVAWSFFICAWVVNFFKIDGVLPKNILTDSLILFGAAVECLLLSLAIADRIRQLTSQRNEMERELLLAGERDRIFRQVSHDIRSPLSALVVSTKNLETIPEDRRLLIRNAIQRITDIANQLLDKSLNGRAPAGCTARLLSPLVDTIVSEKRILCRDRKDILIETDIDQAYGVFANVNSIELKRVISNLINNSLESFRDNRGRVVVSVRSLGGSCEISVVDNGIGIPPQILTQLGEREVTFGKCGSGLGIYHAKKTIEGFGGTLTISSKEQVGTIVTIALPKAKSPRWFVDELIVRPNCIVASVDDDSSIHDVWRERLQASAQFITFTSAHSFLDWFGGDNAQLPSAIFLIDYELAGQPYNGLDLIKKLEISKQSILVTSYYEEDCVRDGCDRLGVKLVPKAMAGFVPIRFLSASEKLESYGGGGYPPI